MSTESELPRAASAKEGQEKEKDAKAVLGLQNDLIFEDWKMTKDRIKHFDDTVIRLRLQGIPIATAIMTLALTSIKFTQPIEINLFCFKFCATSLIMLIGAFYIIPIFLLDMVHYKLLILSVEHAISIEKQQKYKDKLKITQVLTSPLLTRLHTWSVNILYVLLFLSGLMLAYYVNLHKILGV